MSTFLYAMLAIVPIVVLFLSFYSLFRKRAQGVPMKKAMVSHIATLLVLGVLMSALALGASAANEADQPASPAQTEQTAANADDTQADNSKPQSPQRVKIPNPLQNPCCLSRWARQSLSTAWLSRC